MMIEYGESRDVTIYLHGLGPGDLLAKLVPKFDALYEEHIDIDVVGAVGGAYLADVSTTFVTDEDLIDEIKRTTGIKATIRGESR